MIVQSGLARLSKVTSRVVVALSIVVASTGYAQTDEARAAARTAATQGLHALQEGHYQEAVDLCTRAESLMHAPTHLLLIARAQMKLGHLVEAEEAYIKIEREHLAPNSPHAFVDAQAAAADEQAALVPRVPSLKVSIDGAQGADVELTLDGAPFPSALVDMASPINPGTHTLGAKSASAVADPVTVTIAEGAQQAVTLILKPTATTELAERASAGSDRESSDESSEEPSGHPGLRTAGWLGLGVGVVGLAAGTVFVVKNHSDRNDANAFCGANGCPDSKRSDIAGFDQSANTDATRAWISYGVGAAGIVTGAALLWLGHGKAAPPQSGQVNVWFEARSVGTRVTF